MQQIEHYIEELPEPLNIVAYEVRDMVLQCADGVVEKYSYKMPVYHYHGLFCFLIFNKKERALDLSFLRGKDLVEMFPALELRGRHIAASLVLRELKDIDRLHLKEVLATAAAWQVEAKRRGIRLMRTRQT